MQERPQISTFSLDEVFRNEVINHGLDPDYTWINGYLPIIWEKDRYYIEAFLGDIAGKIGLELGCNVGATAIMLSRLGARVTAVDVDKRYVAIAEHNAARYGEEKIQFRWVPAAAALPFPAGSFDFVTATATWSACSTCPLRPRCTPTQRRIIKRWEHEDVLDRMQDQLDRMPEAMGVRRQTVEHPFGTLKAWMGATHFLTRTLDKVRTEMSLHVLAYNIKRVTAIIGVGPLLQTIRA